MDTCGGDAPIGENVRNLVEVGEQKFNRDQHKELQLVDDCRLSTYEILLTT